jgi:hypothetical protein
MHKDFIIDLDNQMENLTMENEALTLVVEYLKVEKDKMQLYIKYLSEQKIKHNNETIQLMNSILNDIHQSGYIQ